MYITQQNKCWWRKQLDFRVGPRSLLPCIGCFFLDSLFFFGDGTPGCERGNDRLSRDVTRGNGWIAFTPLRSLFFAGLSFEAFSCFVVSMVVNALFATTEMDADATWRAVFLWLRTSTLILRLRAGWCQKRAFMYFPKLFMWQSFQKQREMKDTQWTKKSEMR